MKESDVSINYHFLFQAFPDPVIVIDKTGKIIDLNIAAKDTFAEIVIGEKLENIFSDKRKIRESLIELFQYHKVIIDKAILKSKFDELVTYEFKATILSEVKDQFILCFNNLTTKNEILKLEIAHAFSVEMNALRPYLNKAGKELVEKKHDKNKLISLFESQHQTIEPYSLINEDVVAKISSYFPDFNKNELTISFYISIGASVNQIALITGKSANTIRVMIHRMITKVNMESSSKFSKILKEITE